MTRRMAVVLIAIGMVLLTVGTWQAFMQSPMKWVFLAPGGAAFLLGGIRLDVEQWRARRRSRG